MSRKSRAKRMNNLKARDAVPIEWYKEAPAKTSGTCSRCRRGYEVGSNINGHYKYPMHASCWSEHLSERRPSMPS